MSGRTFLSVSVSVSISQSMGTSTNKVVRTLKVNLHTVLGKIDDRFALLHVRGPLPRSRPSSHLLPISTRP